MSKSTQTNIYVAVAVFESSSTADTLYEESIFLIEAVDEQEAHGKAKQVALSRATTYENEDGETIHYTLKELVDVAEVLDDALGDGAELYARHFRNYDAYRSFEPMLDGSID